MTRAYEVKTIREGQHDIFDVNADNIYIDGLHLKIYRHNEADEEILVAVFSDWIYCIEKSPKL